MKGRPSMAKVFWDTLKSTLFLFTVLFIEYRRTSGDPLPG